MSPNAQAAPLHYMQGIAVPSSSVRPEEFFRKTRRHTLIVPEPLPETFSKSTSINFRLLY